jgi:hypothetical protein
MYGLLSRRLHPNLLAGVLLCRTRWSCLESKLAGFHRQAERITADDHSIPFHPKKPLFPVEMELCHQIVHRGIPHLYG